MTALGQAARAISRIAARMHAKSAKLFGLFYDVPWCVPAWGWREFAATARALATGTVVRGREIDRFALAVSKYLRMEFALPVNRGRTAIEVALRALDIGTDDEVILPSYVCPSVLDAVLSTGARPVFADVGDTLNITPDSVAAVMTASTRCVIVAHLFGRAAAVEDIERLVRSRGVRLIDDAAQALGARCGGRLVGSFGDFGIVSCGPGKPLAGAAGGMLVTRDRALFERAAAIHLDREPAGVVARRTIQFWLWRRARRYTLPLRAILDLLRGPLVEAPHMRAALSNLDAAIAHAQLRALERHAAERRRNAVLLARELAWCGGTDVTDLSSASVAVKLVHVLPPTGITAAQCVVTLARQGIEAQGGYTPLHRSPEDRSRLRNTSALWQRVLTVPLETRPRARRRARAPLGLSMLTHVRPSEAPDVPPPELVTARSDPRC